MSSKNHNNEPLLVMQNHLKLIFKGEKYAINEITMKMDSFLLVKGALSQFNFPNFNIYKVTLRYFQGPDKILLSVDKL